MKKLLAGLAGSLVLLVPAFAFAAAPNWNITGTWTFNDIYQSVPYVHTMVINAFDPVTGVFSGTGFYNADPSLTWTVNGTESGSNITVFHLLVNTGAPGVTIDGTGTVNSTSMSGTGYQSNLPEAAPNITWTASGVATPVFPCNGSSTFDTFTLGSVNGQGGWSSTGAYDQAVVNNTYGFATFGCKTLRMSDSVTSGSFGDQTFSPSITNEAGETDALSGGMSSGTRQNHFEASFDLASTMATMQAGMHMSVSPDRGDGARMSYLRFEDRADGIHVFFDDVTDPGHVTNGESFNDTDIATISRGVHTVKFVMDFVNGPDNDVVKIYIDGSLVKTGTSWEDYYRFDTESNPTLASNSRTVDSLLFRESGSADVGNAGNGFLVDNLSVTSSTILPIASAMKGFLQPINDPAIDPSATPSVFKGGSTIPAKFQMTGINPVSPLPTFSYAKLNSLGTAAVDESTSSDTPTSGNTFRYDSAAQQYIYNWSTKGLIAGYWYKITATFGDGSSKSVIVGVR